MKTVVCNVCGREIGFCGWSKHVQKEKKLHGNDVFIRMKKFRKEITRKESKQRNDVRNENLIKFIKG